MGQIALVAIDLHVEVLAEVLPAGEAVDLEDEVRSVDPNVGGIYRWTVGKRLTLTGQWHRMQPARVLFQSEAGLFSLIDWYEEGNHFDGAVPVALRFCRLVTDGQLLRRLADLPG